MADSPLIREQQMRAESPLRLQQQQQQKPVTLYAKWFEEWWLGELLAILLSCILVVVLAVVLKSYDGQPVPSFGTWFNTGITLGTLVSLLTTLAVAADLSVVQQCISQLKWLRYFNSSRPLSDVDTYDGASRGFTGSAKLLWKLRLTPMASIGALLVIANLAIGPLAQQSLLYQSVPIIATNEHATIVTTKDWLENSQQSQTLNMPADYDSISSGMKGAILNGLFASANVTINDTLPTCSSGNCTFPDYQTLALCASTTDLTPQLKNMSTLATPGRWCLPHNFCVDGSAKTGISANITSAAILGEQNTGPGSGLPLNFTSIAFSNRSAAVADFYIIYMNMTDSNAHNGVSYGNSWAAVEFVLDWCAPTFSTQVTNGTAVTKRKSNPKMDFDANVGYMVTAHVGSDTYTIESNTHYTLQRYLNLTFSGLSYLDFGSGAHADSDQVQKLSSLFGVGAQNADILTTRVNGLVALDNLLANTATSMTNYVRSHRNGVFASGIVWTQQTVVRVQWSWIAAPAVFSGVSLLFFLAVLILSTGRGTTSSVRGPPLWKSNAVAAMRCLDPKLQRELGSIHNMASAGSAAQVCVRLVCDEGGWLLVPNTSANSLDRDGDGIELSSKI